MNLDGNAAAGMLFEAYGVEMTMAVGRCANCGTAAPLAEAAAYLRLGSAVLRCAHCDAVLLVVVERTGISCVDGSGFLVP